MLAWLTNIARIRWRQAVMAAGMAVVLVAAGAIGAMPVMAADAPEIELRFGLVDMRGVIQRSDAIAKIRTALDAQNTKFQETISSQELALRNEERELNTRRDELSEDEYNRRLQEFEQKVVAIQQAIQNQKNSFDRSIQQSQVQMEQELLRIVSEIAKERQLLMVFRRQNVVIYENALDITDESLARLNERTKNIKITLHDGAE